MMAGVASDSAGMVGGHNLREPLGFRAVCFVTAGADDGGVEFWRLDRRGIVGVAGERPMAGFASDDNMLSLILLFGHFRVTAFTDGMASVSDRTSRYFSNGGASIVTILTEGSGNDCRSEPDEGHDADRHEASEADEVFYVFEQVLLPRQNLSDPKNARDLGYRVFPRWTMILVTGTREAAHP